MPRCMFRKVMPQRRASQVGIIPIGNEVYYALWRAECPGMGCRRFKAERGVWPRRVVISDQDVDELLGVIGVDE